MDKLKKILPSIYISLISISVVFSFYYFNMFSSLELKLVDLRFAIRGALINEDSDDLDIVLVESGGDNLAATFSPELADLTIYMIDVAMGEEIPRKGGPGITKSDILIINKIDLAEYVDVSIEKMKHDTINQRPHKPFHFVNLKAQKGINEVISSLKYLGGL